MRRGAEDQKQFQWLSVEVLNLAKHHGHAKRGNHLIEKRHCRCQKVVL
jgi:hypothetical protein